MIIRGIIEFFVGLIPVIHVPDVVFASISGAGQWVANVNHYIPVDTFISCLAIYFLVWVICAIVSAVLALL